MSAYGTEKVQTTSLNLGMPSAYQSVYAAIGAKPRFFQQAPGGSPDFDRPGSDFQAHYHEQKRHDSHHMANQKVYSTVMANVRAFTSAHNVPGMPKAVLGQRKFANPSQGSFSSGNPTRQEYAKAPFHFSDAHGNRNASSSNESESDEEGGLHGGVLRTRVGQEYGKARLNDRVKQLNAINEAKAQFNAEGTLRNIPTSFPGAQPTGYEQLGLLPSVELAQLLQSINDSLTSTTIDENVDLGIPNSDIAANRLTFQDSVRAFSLIVRVASSGDRADLDDILEFINGTSASDGILPKLQAVAIGVQHRNNPPAIQKLLLTMKVFWERIKIYLEKMGKTVGLSAKERNDASRAYIKSLGFTKLIGGRLPAELGPQAAQQVLDDNAPDFPRGGPGGGGGEDDGDSSGYVSQFRRGSLPSDGYSEPSWYSHGNSGYYPPGQVDPNAYTRPLIRREDSQQGYRGRLAEFSEDYRNDFAEQSGRMPTGGRGVEEFLPVDEEGGQLDEGRAPEEYDTPQEATLANPLMSMRAQFDADTGVHTIAGPQRRGPQLSAVAEEPSTTLGAPRAGTSPLAQFGIVDRDNLPRDIPSYIRLAENLTEAGVKIRVLPGSEIANVRKNFIRRFNL